MPQIIIKKFSHPNERIHLIPIKILIDSPQGKKLCHETKTV